MKVTHPTIDTYRGWVAQYGHLSNDWRVYTPIDRLVARVRNTEEFRSYVDAEEAFKDEITVTFSRVEAQELLEAIRGNWKVEQQARFIAGALE